MKSGPSFDQSMDNTQCGDPTQGQHDNLKDLQEMSNRARRNALTPESHNIEPIRQTEIQEKMSGLSMTSADDSGSGTSKEPEGSQSGS